MSFFSFLLFFLFCLDVLPFCIWHVIYQLVFSTEQCVFIYDQYLLTQSASQVRRLFETRFPGVEISSRSSGRLKNAVYKTTPQTLEELKRNIRDDINNINRGELQKVMENFRNRCQKCMDNEGGQFQHLRP